MESEKGGLLHHVIIIRLCTVENRGAVALSVAVIYRTEEKV